MTTVSRRGVLAAGAAAVVAVGAAGNLQVSPRTALAQEDGEQLVFDFEFNGVKTKTVELERDGLVLRGRLEVPAEVPDKRAPLVIMMHGARGNSRCDLYDNLCLGLASRGYAALRFDFDGHGDSDGAFDDSTVLTELDDLAAIVEYAEAFEWADGVYALGHSQGGCVATMFAGQNPDVFKAVAVVDPAVNIQDNCASGSLDGKASEAYVSVGKELDIFGTVGGYEGPVCVIHGLDDTVVLPEYAQRLSDAYEQQVDLHFLAGAAHTPASHSAVILELVDAFFKRAR